MKQNKNNSLIKPFLTTVCSPDEFLLLVLLSDQQHSEDLLGCSRLHRTLCTLRKSFPILNEPWLWCLFFALLAIPHSSLSEGFALTWSHHLCLPHLAFMKFFPPAVLHALLLSGMRWSLSPLEAAT